jgi:hypothetical protein
MTDALLGVFAQTDARGLNGSEFIQCFAALASRKLSHKIEVLFRAFSGANAADDLEDAQGSYESYMTDPHFSTQTATLTAPDMDAAVRHTFMVCACICVCVCVCVCMCMYVYVYVYAYTEAGTCVCSVAIL